MRNAVVFRALLLMSSVSLMMNMCGMDLTVSVEGAAGVLADGVLADDEFDQATPHSPMTPVSPRFVLINLRNNAIDVTRYEDFCRFLRQCPEVFYTPEVQAVVSRERSADAVPEMKLFDILQKTSQSGQAASSPGKSYLGALHKAICNQNEQDFLRILGLIAPIAKEALGKKDTEKTESVRCASYCSEGQELAAVRDEYFPSVPIEIPRPSTGGSSRPQGW